MRVLAVRAAVVLEDLEEKNPSEWEGPIMIEAMGRLFDALREVNDFTPENLISMQFTQTADLRYKNAAAALREAKPLYADTPLFCAIEPTIEGSLLRVVRVLVTWHSEGNATPVYLGKAQSLRPDYYS